jgi:hypothetical protein
MQERTAMSRIVSPPIGLPPEQHLPAWRAAVLAYRRNRQAGEDHHAAFDAALGALRQMLPEMPEREAVQEVIQAIAYAAREHTSWFWRGVGGR